MEKTTLYLPADLQARLRAQAKRESRAQADIVRDAVTQYLTKQPDGLARFVGAFEGPGDRKEGATIKRELRTKWKKDLSKTPPAKAKRARP